MKNQIIEQTHINQFEHLVELEFELEDGIKEAEVTNTSCVYFGETVWVTHKAYAGGDLWYKAELGYYIGESSDTEVWFREDELHMEGGSCEDF